MGIFVRERGQAASAVPTSVEFQPMSVTADQLKRVIDDWKRAERSLRELAGRWEQLWAQAEAVVAAQDIDEFVRLSELITATPQNLEQSDMREAIFARIDKVEYTPSMMHIVENISVSLQSSEAPHET